MTLYGSNISWSQVPAYPACQIVDLTKYWNMTEIAPYLIEIGVAKIEHLGFSLTFEDRETVLKKRRLKSKFMDFDRAPIELEDLNSTQFIHLYLKFKQTLEIEDCGIYPNENFKDYNECDEEYVYREMKNTYKIMPFWAAKTLDEVTKQLYVLKNKWAIESQVPSPILVQGPYLLFII